MGRNSVSTPDSAPDDATSTPAPAAFHPIRCRFPCKRYNNNYGSASAEALPRTSKATTPTFSHNKASRSLHHHKRRLSLFPFKGKSWFYLCIFMVIFTFAFASMVLQNSIMSVFRQGVGRDKMRWRWSVKEGLELGSSLEFVPPRPLELNGSRLNWLRSQPRIGVRPPRIGLILGHMNKDPSALMLYSVIKNLKGLGYLIKIYALRDGMVRSIWQEIGGHVSILTPERYGYIDWSLFEGIVVDSLEAKDAISRSLSALFL